jgi:hypothetical protein
MGEIPSNFVPIFPIWAANMMRFFRMPFGFVGVVLLGLAVTGCGRTGYSPAVLPTLQVEGWIGEPVTRESVAGKVVVLDFWAHW